MKRRTFLTSSLSAVPMILVESALNDSPVLAALSSRASTDDEIHVVRAGEDQFGEVHPRGFSLIQFKVSTEEASGRTFILEHSNLLPGGPPLHFHPNQDEWFYVMEGEVLFQIGAQRMQLKVGDSVFAPRKVPHTFTAVGSKPGKLLIAFSPAGKMEQFFRDATRPDAPPQDAAFYRRYGMEIVGPQIK